MADLTPEQAQQKQLVDSILKNQNVPKYYMNGFNIGESLSDMFIVMNLMGSAFGVLHMSFTTAKTLMASLQEAVKNFENKTGQPLLTMFDIQEKGKEQIKQ